MAYDDITKKPKITRLPTQTVTAPRGSTSPTFAQNEINGRKIFPDSFGTPGGAPPIPRAPSAPVAGGGAGGGGGGAIAAPLPPGYEAGAAIRGVVAPAAAATANFLGRGAGALRDEASYNLQGLANFGRGLVGSTPPAPAPSFENVGSGVATAPAITRTVTPSGQPQQLPTQVVRPPGVGIVPTRIAGISEVTGNPDGSRTFTDRPDATAAALATRGNLRNPGAVPTAERDAYLKTVPELGSGPTVTRPVAGGGGGGGGISPDLAARFARSDAIAIANEDPRSALGSAARNARLRRDYAGPQTRAQREQSGEAYRQTLAALGGPGAAQIQTAADLQRTNAQEAGATERAAIGADAGIAQAQISRPRPQSQQVTLADGTIAQVGENGVSRPVTDASGKPIRALMQKDDASTKRAQQLMDELSKRAATLIDNSALAGKPLSVVDARAQAAQSQGHQVKYNDQTGEALVNIEGQWVPLL